MASSTPRAKRTGGDYGLTHYEQDDGGPSDNKKPRFDLRNPSALAADDLEEDEMLDADEIGRRGQKVRRSAINLDGYDSDSDNEGFSARAHQEAKDKKAQEKDDTMLGNLDKDFSDDDDMAAELDKDFGDEDEMDKDFGDEGDNDGPNKNKKSVRFLQDSEIEGQVASSKGGKTLRADFSKGADDWDPDADDSEEEDVAEEERARIDQDMDAELGAGAKKKNAPLIDAFNMKAEQEEGRFDEAGNYIRKAADPDAQHDSWLEGVSKKDIRKAKEAAEKREAEEREKELREDQVSTSDALKTIISYLERGETILDALARLGKGLPRKPKWQNKKKTKQSNAPEDTEMSEENPVHVSKRKAIEALTGAADILMGQDQPTIYDTERELLTRQYRRDTGEDWVDPPRNY
ncbi:hypothetical protein N7468_004027 [Penicillium chermesinum]|uniref:Lin1 family protein n=1 Tax=Penicillium chermesinum TaxID=63820 RepID=A0A9W9TST5_9EURO|nr:uncharacterized protein N7468_004027 [Penicillium chermesinum]KAJ5239408.1 hypothetical protein N7468_004027 [Penicillium chermesinum]